MLSSTFSYQPPSSVPHLVPVVREEQIDYGFIGKLQNLKYEYRADILDFREKSEALNRGHLTIASAKQKHNEFLKELALPPLP